ncbi:MAG TPA: PIN domain-containing protein [Methyloceanibacter sp.]|nr:PIN domain-containing protein [Methyloceanibacter sp.]
MTARYFADSNVLVYARDTTEETKRRRASLWLDHLWDERSGHLSYQVLSECYSILTRRRGMRPTEARGYVESFLAWQPLVIDGNLFARAWETQDRFGLNWWDCLIVAAARARECAYLLTEDLQHGQDLEGITVLNPFEAAPSEVG